MNIFPVTQADNFFDNPDKVRNFGLSLDFKRSPNGRWPGERTLCVSSINHGFYEDTAMRILRIFYPEPQDQPNISFRADAYFQKIPKDFFNSKTHEGWIHSDYPNKLTAIIYLTPSSTLNNGTSIFRLEEDIFKYNNHNNEIKEAFYNNKVPDDQENLAKQQNNSQFKEIARVGGHYNSMVCFDSAAFHAGRDLLVDSDEDRLTLVYFFKNIDALEDYPLVRSKRDFIY
jgi:hypothetical protein